MTSVARRSLERIAIVGDGPVGISAAIMLRLALPRANVLVIAVPPNAAAFADNAATALPFSNRFHEGFGLDEAVLIQRAGAGHRLVTRWAVPDGAAAYGEQSEGRSAHFASLAREMRFAPVAPFTADDYALRWHPAAYRALLIERAQQIGVRYHAGGVAHVDRDPSGIRSIELHGGAPVLADLYIDASGPSAVIGSVLGGHEIDWTDVLPFRQVAVASIGESALALHDDVQWSDAGLRVRHHGRDGVSDTLIAFGDGQSTDAIALSPGRRCDAWIGNVVMIGDAYAVIPPLLGAPLDLAQRQIALLIDLLPGLPIFDGERAEYNRRAAQMADATRDWIASALLAFRPPSEPDGSRAAAIVDQFRRRGTIPFVEDAPLGSSEWRAQLSAQGLANPPVLPSGLFTSDEWARVPSYPQWMWSVLGAS